MNFKKYHVSRNLWNVIKYSYTSLSENNVWVYRTSLTGSVYRIPCKPNTTYTLYLAENVDITIWRIREVSTDVVPNASSTSVPTTGTYASSVPASKSATFATSASAQYILFQTNESAYDSVLPVIMLIEGNTKIPYEPYSSEAWHDIPHYIHNTSTDTIATLPAVIYPTDTTATVGLKGNMSQSSTPSPTTPIQPQECGENATNILSAYKENYSINADGKEIPNDVAMIYKANVVVLGSTFTLTFGGLLTGDTVRIHAYTGDTWQEQVNAINIEQVPFSFTVGSNIDNIRISIRKTATDVTMTDGQYKIGITSASITTPIYLGEVESTRKIKKLVLTGEEAFTKNNGQSTNYLYYANRGTIIPGSIGKTPVLCNELPVKDSAPQTDIGMNTNNNFSVVYFNFGEDVMNAQPSGNTVAGLKEYLAAQYAAGTPVTVWYVLATPETAVVNEPIRKIGDYADTVSGISIPTIAGANTLSVDTTLQPSEVTVNYKGWHPVADVHERESGQWD